MVPSEQMRRSATKLPAFERYTAWVLGLRMFVSMVLIDGAVLFVLYALIAIFGTSRAGIASLVPAVLMILAGFLVRPRPRATRAVRAEPPSPAPEIGRYR